MKTISKGKLKAHMLEEFREIQKTGMPLIVTDHRVPVLIIEPFTQTQSIDRIFSDLQGQVSYAKDVWKSDKKDWGSLL